MTVAGFLGALVVGAAFGYGSQRGAFCLNSGLRGVLDGEWTKVKALGLSGQGKVRINQAGCLDRCEEGPCVVVYPDAVWYTYVDQSDIDEIVEEHLKNGRVVERLRM